LGKFFPPSNPLSAWMMRLAIIRDDLAFELDHLGLNEEDGSEEVWRCNYFIRKLCVTMLEAVGVFSQDVQKLANRDRASLPPKLPALLTRARQILDEARPVLEPIRNTVGAHVRPANADPGRDAEELTVEAQVLGYHASYPVHVRVDFKEPQRMSFRGLTIVSTFFAWPDSTDLAAVLERHKDLRKHLMLGARSLLGAISLLLVDFWIKIGAVEVPPDVDIVLVAPKGWPRNIEGIDDPDKEAS
jgi:hypothetical protein